MTRIKICGIKTEKQAVAAARAGADFLGLVFAPSLRQVTPETAAKIVAALKKEDSGVEVVGVFVNTDAGTANRIAEDCHLDRIQLSGDEPWEYCRKVERPIIKVMRVSRDNPPWRVLKDIERGMKILNGHDVMLLLDTPSAGKYGGTGETFEWDSARPIARQFPVIIAGGLTPANVSRAIELISPWGVDVSTGVETRGTKDMKKIRKFIEAVRRTDAHA